MWAFKPKGDKTQVTFDMEYEFGGGIAGKLLGRAAEPIVRGNLQRSVETLKLHTEKLGAAKSAAKAGARQPQQNLQQRRDASARDKQHKICNKDQQQGQEPRAKKSSRSA